MGFSELTPIAIAVVLGITAILAAGLVGIGWLSFRGFAAVIGVAATVLLFWGDKLRTP